MADKRDCNHQRDHSQQGRRHRHPSSFWMHDPDRVFRELALKEGGWFLDAGCGTGDYSIHASRIVGESGVVYALDQEATVIADLNKEVASKGLGNIRAIVAGITAPLPIDSHCIDVCLIATVLHIPDVARGRNELFAEVRRFLKPHGRMAIVECKKEHWSWGPPVYMHLVPEEIDFSITPHRFKKIGVTELGWNYMMRFVVE